MHRLQMLLRMAEVTKLEEHIKCQRRADNVKEEKIGLLTVIHNQYAASLGLTLGGFSRA